MKWAFKQNRQFSGITLIAIAYQRQAAFAAARRDECLTAMCAVVCQTEIGYLIMPWPFDELASSVHTSFSKATADYNQIKHAADKLKHDTEQLQNQGIMRTGLTNVLLNRYGAIKSLEKLPEKAQDGANWARYFVSCPDLKKDVEDSAKQWAYEKMRMPTLQGVKTAVATVGGTTPAQTEELKNAAQAHVGTQMQALGVSVGAGKAISLTLKTAGQQAQNQYLKLGLQYGRRSWQVTGVLAFAYGLSKISDAMHETGPFASSLKERRDSFNSTQKWKISDETENAVRMLQDV